MDKKGYALFTVINIFGVFSEENLPESDIMDQSFREHRRRPTDVELDPNACFRALKTDPKHTARQ